MEMQYLNLDSRNLNCEDEHLPYILGYPSAITAYLYMHVGSRGY